MKMHFIGQTIFSAYLLESIRGLVEITGITTAPRVGSDDMDLIPWGGRYGIDNAAIRREAPDYILCCGWHQIIRRETLEIAPVIGYHPSPLPVGRGCSPIIWAIDKGLKETASTFFFMDEGVDTGDIISQWPVEIPRGMTAKGLYIRLMATAGTQIKSLIRSLKEDTFVRRTQDETGATYWPKRQKERDRWIEYW